MLCTCDWASSVLLLVILMSVSSSMPESPRASLTMLGGENATPEFEFSALLCIYQDKKKSFSVNVPLVALTKAENDKEKAHSLIPASPQDTGNPPSHRCLWSSLYWPLYSRPYSTTIQAISLPSFAVAADVGAGSVDRHPHRSIALDSSYFARLC